ncbi:hypothetical protein SAMN02745117_01231 [Lampropedia hyalina DSM 16112]|uniref:Uncharacterized protein n=2 Tax=Lampropedia TaxID=198705 RepID=A0A1M4YCC4_9BURK|nr:hypothetical protein SAMN02745117_01231 [Lampropedia hyalina DSM 16112]
MFLNLRKDIHNLRIKVKRDETRGILITKVTSSSDHFVSMIQQISHPEVVEAFFKKKHAGPQSQEHFLFLIDREAKSPQIGKVVFYSEEAQPFSWIENLIYEQLC